MRSARCLCHVRGRGATAPFTLTSTGPSVRQAITRLPCSAASRASGPRCPPARDRADRLATTAVRHRETRDTPRRADRLPGASPVATGRVSRRPSPRRQPGGRPSDTPTHRCSDTRAVLGRWRRATGRRPWTTRRAAYGAWFGRRGPQESRRTALALPAPGVGRTPAAPRRNAGDARVHPPRAADRVVEGRAPRLAALDIAWCPPRPIVGRRGIAATRLEDAPPLTWWSERLHRATASRRLATIRSLGPQSQDRAARVLHGAPAPGASIPRRQTDRAAG